MHVEALAAICVKPRMANRSLATWRLTRAQGLFSFSNTVRNSLQRFCSIDHFTDGSMRVCNLVKDLDERWIAQSNRNHNVPDFKSHLPFSSRY